MARPSKTDTEKGFVEAFWKEVKTLEADFTGLITIAVYPAARPGVLYFRISFTPLLVEDENPLGSAAVQVEFPNASTQTLAGALWSASMKLYHLVSDASNERKARQRNGR